VLFAVIGAAAQAGGRAPRCGYAMKW